jgi:protease I
MKPALIITGKNVQDHEYIYPYYRLQEDGFAVDVATDGKTEVMGQLGAAKVTPTLGLDNLNPADFQVLVLPGGAKCMEYVRQDRRIIDFISAFNATGKVIGSICHAAQLLISAKVVKGRKISGYYSLKDDINNAGAIYVDEPVVADGNIISTAHYKHLGPWMKAVCDAALKTK